MKETRRYTSSRASVDYPFSPASGELEIDLPAGAKFGVCLTHDIDHLGLTEHFVDGFLLRYLVYIVRRDVLVRFQPIRALRALAGALAAPIGRDPWDVTDDLLDEEQRVGFPSTWFAAVKPGLGIAYRPSRIREAARRIASAGQEVALHGQSSDDAEALAAEANTLAVWLDQPVRGLRMHYLRVTEAVVAGMEQADLRYEASVMNRRDLAPERHPLDAPRLLRGRIIEIPLHVMDSTLFSPTGLAFDRNEALGYCRRLMARAAERGRVVTINMHPNNFSDQNPECRAWYRAMLGELNDRSDVFVTDMRGLAARVKT